LLAERTQYKLNKIQGVLDYYNKLKLLPITIRQLYYEMVTKNIIANNLKEYKKFVKLMTYARENYIIPYNNIVDSTRGLDTPIQFDHLKNLRHVCLTNYKLKRWEDQEYYIEVWVEKDAMASTLLDISQKYCVPFMSNRGYSSTTAMHDANRRFKYQIFKRKKQCKIIYLGDHDPSGLDMDNDIMERVLDVNHHEVLERIALTKQQIDDYNLPPNPAKLDDPRAKSYISTYGEDSWELEAYPIKELRELLEDKLRSYIEFSKYNRVLDHEKLDKGKIMKIFP